MKVMQGLQEAMAASKVEQERIQLDLAASQARNEELFRANEELRHGCATTLGIVKKRIASVSRHLGSFLCLSCSPSWRQ